MRITLCLLAVAAASAHLAHAQDLAKGVRGVATRAPEKVVIDGDLAEFERAFCTPINYFHDDVKNRPAQFFYMWDDEAFYAALRTLDEFAAKTQVIQQEGSFAKAVAAWPIDVAPPGAHHVTAIVYGTDGEELTRIAPRLVSTSMKKGY